MIFPKITLRIERWKFNKEYGVYVSTLGNFKDRHKRNNTLTNLEWVTYEENLRRAARDLEKPIKTSNSEPRPKQSKSTKKVVTAVKINNTVVPADVDSIYAVMCEIYYKGGYPKATIEKTLKDLKSGKNCNGSKKLGQKVKISAIYEGE